MCGDLYVYIDMLWVFVVVFLMTFLLKLSASKSIKWSHYNSFIYCTLQSCKVYNTGLGVAISKLISGLLCNSRWDLWPGAMGSPSQLNISTLWTACWSPSYTAGVARGATSPSSWSLSFTFWRISLRAHTHPTISLFNPDNNSVSGAPHQCCHRFQGNKRIQRANQTTSKVCIHLIHSRVERRGLTLSGFLISPCPRSRQSGYTWNLAWTIRSGFCTVQ